MTNEDRKKILFLKAQGLGYKRIAAETGISVNTIKSFLKKNNPTDNNRCFNCGKTIVQIPHKKQKKFCSDKCRNAWWSAHPEKRKGKPYIHTCLYCEKEFSTDKVVSKYCSRDCFAKARRGAENL